MFASYILVLRQSCVAKSVQADALLEICRVSLDSRWVQLFG